MAGLVKVKIGEKEYNAKLTFDSIMQIEARADMGLAHLVGSSKMGFTMIAYILMLGIRNCDGLVKAEKLQKEMAAAFQEGNGLGTMSDNVARLLKASGFLGKAEEDQKDEEEPELKN